MKLHGIENRYAVCLTWGRNVSFVLLCGTFLAYAAGLVAPLVPLDSLHEYWGMPAGEYLEAVNRDFAQQPEVLNGWRWVAFSGRADMMNLWGIVLLSSITIGGYLALLKTFHREKKTILLVIAVVQIVV